MKNKVFKPIKLSVDLCSIKPNITELKKPVFYWAAQHSGTNKYQSAYRITAVRNGNVIWDTSFVETSEQFCAYSGKELFDNDFVEWSLVLKDNDGAESEAASSEFTVSFGESFNAGWIAAKNYERKNTNLFFKSFCTEKDASRAVLKVCGLGIHEVYLNGKRPDDYFFQPVFTSYNKRTFYNVYFIEKDKLEKNNSITVILADGWRNNVGKWSEEMLKNHPVPLFGEPVLAAELTVFYKDGTSDKIITDDTWKCQNGFVKSHLFEGETFDERLYKKSIFCGSFAEDDVVIRDCPAERLHPQTVEPERIAKIHKPVNIIPKENGRFLVDFGVNISGVCRIKIPPTKSGQEIVIRHAEMLSDDGNIYTENLRSAYSVDKFIADDCEYSRRWNPHFTYHGFRYAEIEGADCLEADDIEALEIHSDVRRSGHFECSNQVINGIQKIILQTELNNIHGLFSDCPQRDERMGWMNDSTVRFEEVPYNFNVAKLFDKVVGDCVSEQGENGEFTCTAPYFFGCRPADPVCSAPIVAMYKGLMFYGDKALAAKYFEKAEKWNDYLTSISDDGIIEYSLYGDWAGPADCCKAYEDPHSAVTSGTLMSTCMHLYNYIMLAEIAKYLKMTEAEKRNRAGAELVRKKIAERFTDLKTGRVDTASQGSQAVALKTGVFSGDAELSAADLMNTAVINAGNRLTTGNLNTKYLFDMLSKYGYTDTAFELMTREEYPSLGYMMKQGATTVWERFEDKKNSEMNSHDHPMYGACGSWFYEYLAGITPDAPGFERILIKPCFPKKLDYMAVSIETVKGQIYVKWKRKDNGIKIDLSLPFGTHTRFYADKEYELGSGFYTFFIKEDS